MSRTAAQVIPGAPHEVLLVLDATTGQNGLEQARKFTETLRRHRHRADQARRHGQRRNRGGDRARAESADPLRRHRREGGRPAAVRRRRSSSSRSSMTHELADYHARGARPGRARARRRRAPTRWWAQCWCATDEVVGRGFHTYAGVKHAEIIALDAGRRAAPAAPRCTSIWSLARTGPHAAVRGRADRARAWREVVAAMEDPNPLVSRKGFRKLRAAGIEVGDRRRSSRRGGEAERGVRALHAHRPAAGHVENRDHAGRQDRRAGRQSRLDHQRARARARAAAAPRHRRHPHRHRHGAGRRLPAHRSHRAAAQPPAAAHRDGFAAAPSARFQDGACARRTMWW